jgi:transposase InsO family protein
MTFLTPIEALNPPPMRSPTPCERIYLMSYATGFDLQAGLTDYFGFYNTKRPHQSLEYRTPKGMHCG